jgi:hypothetical protein
MNVDGMSSAEGATTPESLRQRDRTGEATLESSTVPEADSSWVGFAEGERPVRLLEAFGRLKLSGADDSGGARQPAHRRTR